MSGENELYESMPISKAVITLVIPTVISQLITVAYNMADTFFIGQLNDPAQVAAATVSMPPFVLLTGIANLFGIGGSSLISRYLGMGEREKAKNTSAFCIWSAAIVSLIYGLIFVALKPYVLPILGAKTSTYDYCYTYLFWTVSAGAVPTVMNACLAHLIRSEGMSKQAGFGVALGGIMNVILDPLFILVFKMDIAGAAIATALSNVIATIYFIIIIYKRRHETVITAKLAYFSMKNDIPKNVCIIGLPNFILIMMGILSNTAINNFMASYSDEAIAGIGIAKKIDMLTFSIVNGMTQGVISLVAYNYASGNIKRMLQAIKTTFTYTLFIGIGVTAVLFVGAEPISKCFIADSETVAYSQQFLKIICLICPLQAVTMIVITVFQAMGGGIKPLILSFMRKGIIDVPLMFLLNGMVGIIGIACSTPITEIIACVVSIFLIIPTFLSLKKGILKSE